MMVIKYRRISFLTGLRFVILLNPVMVLPLEIDNKHVLKMRLSGMDWPFYMTLPTKRSGPALKKGAVK